MMRAYAATCSCRSCERADELELFGAYETSRRVDTEETGTVGPEVREEGKEYVDATEERYRYQK